MKSKSRPICFSRVLLLAMLAFSLTRVDSTVVGAELTGTVTPAAFGDRFNLTALGTSDWAHWGLGGDYGAFDHKATGGNQISDVTVVETEAGDSGKAVAAANYLARLASWSDGLPTASVTDDYGFIYAGDVPADRQGIGYSFTVRADTTLRTLYVLAGGYGTTPTLQASLSDSSAPDFVNATPGGGANYQRVYAITYRAASSNQTLAVTFTRTAGSASVDLKAAWLLIGAPPTVSVSITAPTNGATVMGNPASVTIIADASADRTIAQVEFFADGFLVGSDTTSPYSITWAAAPGSHALTAKATDNAGNSKVSAAVAIGVFTGGGELGGTATPPAFGARFDLTALGTSDWAHWGLGGVYGAFDHKATGGSQISDVTALGAGHTGLALASYQPRLASWSGGTPTASVTDDYGFIYTEVTGSGFSFTVPATTTLRTLYVLVGGGGPTPTLRASLSDFSAADFVDTRSAASQYQNVYAIPFRAASAGQTLTVTYTKTAGSGSVDLKAAWLVGNPSVPPLLLSVQSVGHALTGQGSLVTVVFDERMDQTSAETVSNYSIDGGSVAISGAVLQSDLKRVVLTTGGITPSVNHTLNVTGVKDRFGNTMAPSSKQFQTTHLVARYSLDDLVNPGADSSGGGHNAAVVGVRFSAPGQFGNAFAFNGSTHLIAPFSPAFIEIVEQLTVAIWIKKTVADQQPAGVALVSRRWEPSFQDEWILFYGSGGADAYSWYTPTTDDAATILDGGASTADLNKWVHFAGTYDGTEMRIYTNGVLAATTALTGIFRPDTELTPLLIGGGDNGTSGFTEFFTGQMDEVAIYNRALSAAEIAGMAVPLRFQSQVVANGRFELTWTGTGQLERASNVLGPWATVPGATSSPYSEPLVSTENRFFRLRASP